MTRALLALYFLASAALCALATRPGNTTPEVAAWRARLMPPETDALELLRVKVAPSADGTRLVAEGAVRSLSDEPLDGVKVALQFWTRAGDLISQDIAPVAVSPLLPGQASEWSVSTAYAPEKTRAHFDFSMGAAPLKWRRPGR